jgi:hypothetical protein
MFHGMDVPWFLMSVAGETHCKINGKKIASHFFSPIRNMRLLFSGEKKP